MAKNRFFYKKKLPIASIVWGTLLSSLSAAAPENNSLSLSVHLENSLLAGFDIFMAKKRFFDNAFRPTLHKLLPPESPETSYAVQLEEKLGEGRYGKVYKASFANEDVAVKQFSSEEFAKQEFDKAKELFECIRENVDQISKSTRKKIKHIVLPYWQTDDGSLIQRLIIGNDLYHTITQGLHPYPNGQPDDLGNAILRAIFFFTILAIIHRLGIVIGDLNPGNLILSDNPSINYPIYFIDFALAQQIGKYLARIFLTQRESLPCEYQEASQEFLTYQEQLRRIDHELLPIQQQLQNPQITAPIKQELEPRQTTLQLERQAILTQLQSISYPKAHPAFDIYRSIYVLKFLLFGKFNLSIYEPSVREEIEEIFQGMANPDPLQRLSATDINLKLTFIYCKHFSKPETD
ncbi:MAG: hypothetical protein LBH08_03360 [Puniceicoccales bacterium]|nr:hypothetical protein [Puniceicoccales bacterium]